ncbi:4-hydroxy-tetrahydrodipicolinate synthase [Cyclobacterium xiamenense]|uniref:4-hydroxy-tetrahydrodipicolinate synthase n=1 Tax=Cyclobacterium xiamenense TaxID=1297121 RepID=A0A1H6T7J9_9BACT|nr:dihydrodipicolinate synthase family protein [Cyclobacterium xiamenense]SEI76049.1 4-hydroxy-tetrahydrodipicolinate synthase [Cyclobacterium xiamenense]
MNKTLYPLFGIVTVLNTPFKTDGGIDYAALRLHVREAMAAGVAGFLVPAMASEVYQLSHPERLKLVETVLETVNGEVPVFAGAGEPDPARGKSLLAAYLELGCKQVLFQIPFRDETQFKTDFYRLAELNVQTIMLQDWDASGYGLPENLICELFEQVEAFQCLKIETVPAGYKYSRMLALTDGRLHVSGGWAVAQMIEGLERGVHAFMPTAMHWAYTEIYRCWKQGGTEEATELFYRILPVLAFSNQHLEISIHFFKRLLARQGIYPTAHVRVSSIPFDSQHQVTSDRLIQRVIELENEIKWSRNAL